MKDVYVVKELEQIKALSNPYRISIIEAFGGEEATAKQISQKLGEPHSKVNYHIKLLAKVKLLELVKEAPKYGVIEKFYKPIAKNFRFDGTVMKGMDNAPDSQYKPSIALFERISKDFYNNVEDSKSDLISRIFYSAEVYLTEENIDEILNMVSEFAMENTTKDLEANECKKYSLGLTVSPRVVK